MCIRDSCKFCDHHSICHGQEAPAVNCRTCMHSTPIEEGEWHCARHDMDIPESVQKSGCELHLYNPYLLEQFAEPTDSGEFWIRYRLKSTGEEFVTGTDKGQFSSQEIRAVEDKRLLTDEKLAGLKEQFDGTIETNQ